MRSQYCGACWIGRAGVLGVLDPLAKRDVDLVPGGVEFGDRRDARTGRRPRRAPGCAAANSHSASLTTDPSSPHGSYPSRQRAPDPSGAGAAAAAPVGRGQRRRRGRARRAARPASTCTTSTSWSKATRSRWPKRSPIAWGRRSPCIRASGRRCSSCRTATGHVDFISARRERYPSPGALPVVEPGTLRDDLARRDFTVNAMAVRITGAQAGELVDPHDGVARSGRRGRPRSAGRCIRRGPEPHRARGTVRGPPGVCDRAGDPRGRRRRGAVARVGVRAGGR